MNWTLFDFIFAGVLIGTVGTALAVVFWKARSFAYRGAAITALAGSFVLIWVTGAVGIIGSSANDANLMYGGVITILLGGALLSRFRAPGMTGTLVVAAAAQLAIGGAALAGGMGSEGASWPWDVVGATIIFTGIWLVSAALFRLAARAGNNTGPAAAA